MLLKWWDIISSSICTRVSADYGCLRAWTCAAPQDVVYPVMNQRAMTYVGGGARDAQAWLDFLGTVKDARTPPAGSPFQAGTQLTEFQLLYYV